jgi:hypothetical protein
MPQRLFGPAEDLLPGFKPYKIIAEGNLIDNAPWRQLARVKFNGDDPKRIAIFDSIVVSATAKFRDNSLPLIGAAWAL